MKAIPFKAEHIDLIPSLNCQPTFGVSMVGSNLGILEGQHSYTAIDGDEILGCMGVHEMWSGRGLAWAILSAGIGPKRIIELTEMCIRYFDFSPFNRLEADVVYEFRKGHKWAKRLGFTVETDYMKNYFPDGSAATRYVRLR